MSWFRSSSSPISLCTNLIMISGHQPTYVARKYWSTITAPSFILEICIVKSSKILVVWTIKNKTRIRKSIRSAISWICFQTLMRAWTVWWKHAEKRMSSKSLNAKFSETLSNLSGISTPESFITSEQLFIQSICWLSISMYSTSYSKTTIQVVSMMMVPAAMSLLKTPPSWKVLTPNATS